MTNINEIKLYEKWFYKSVYSLKNESLNWMIIFETNDNNTYFDSIITIDKCYNFMIKA